MRRRRIEVVKTHDDMTYEHTEQSFKGVPHKSGQSQTIVLGELGGNLLFVSPAGLAGVKPGSDLSADCVVSCQTV